MTLVFDWSDFKLFFFKRNIFWILLLIRWVIIMDSSINYRNKYKMSKERRSTCRVSKHFRDILADANYTIHKLENM